MWILFVLVPDHCLSVYFKHKSLKSGFTFTFDDSMSNDTHLSCHILVKRQTSPQNTILFLVFVEQLNKNKRFSSCFTV